MKATPVTKEEQERWAELAKKEGCLPPMVEAVQRPLSQADIDALADDHGSDQCEDRGEAAYGRED